MKIIVFITEGTVIRQIPGHLGEPTSPPRLMPARGPPLWDDLHDAVRTAVINKRAGGMGLISGRKAFQKPMAEGVALLNAIQDVCLARNIEVA